MISKEELIKDCTIQLYVWGVTNNEYNYSNKQIVKAAITRAKEFADIYEELINQS